MKHLNKINFFGVSLNRNILGFARLYFRPLKYIYFLHFFRLQIAYGFFFFFLSLNNTIFLLPIVFSLCVRNFLFNVTFK